MYFLWPRYLAVPDRRFLLTLGPVSSEETRPIGKFEDIPSSCRRLIIDRTVTMLSRDPGAEGRYIALPRNQEVRFNTALASPQLCTSTVLGVCYVRSRGICHVYGRLYS